MKALLTLIVVAFPLLAGWNNSNDLPARESPASTPQQLTPISDFAFEAAQTEKLLGVLVKRFPLPEGPSGFVELPANAPAFKFTVTERPLSGPKPRALYETRRIVEARAPDGSIYEAYCGHDDPKEIVPGHGFVSTLENRRQRYDTHYGYAYSPQDIFIGKREAGRLKPALFFRDVGSQDTAPHYLAMDDQGLAHLAVADVNLSQNNWLDLYWVIGDPKTGKWNAAWLVDRRGFTSWSQPWSAPWKDKVHLVWDWCDVTNHKRAPGMGAFHVEWGPNGFTHKVRIISGPVNELDAAVDPESGRLLIVLAKNAGGVYVLSRSADGRWTRPVLLHSRLRGRHDVSVVAANGGTFMIRTGSDDTREWLLRPQ